REFPVFGWVIKSLRKSLVLFFATDVQHDFQNHGPIAYQILFKLSDGPVPTLQTRRRSKALDAVYQHILVMRAVKHRDFTVFGCVVSDAPEKIMLEFFGRWFLEPNLVNSLRVHRPNHVFGHTTLAAGVHALDDQQDRAS